MAKKRTITHGKPLVPQVDADRVRTEVGQWWAGVRYQMGYLRDRLEMPGDSLH